MARAMQVYDLSYSIEKGRPEIDFDDAANSSIDWSLVPEIDPDKESLKRYRPFEVTIHRTDALDWDYYSNAGTLGLLSERAMELLRPLASQYFMFLEAKINGAPYFTPFRRTPLDCLDREHSILVPFEHAPSRIKRIDKYCFRSELIEDPLIFCIPESRGAVLATQSVRQKIEEAGLRGFCFQEVWREDKND